MSVCTNRWRVKVYCMHKQTVHFRANVGSEREGLVDGHYASSQAWPGFFPTSLSLTARATISTPPPGGKAAMTRMGLVGYCAAAGAAAITLPAVANSAQPIVAVTLRM